LTVRVSAKELTSLILDEDRLRSERSDRKLWKTRVTGIDEFGPQAIAGPVATRPRERAPRPQRPDEEDAEYRLAIEASKHEAEEDKKRRAKNAVSADDDDDLAKAIRLSKEEEELRRRELEDQNAASLFDDTPTPAQPQATGWNQGYQQQPAVDWFGNPLTQQPQTTGYLNNQYAQQPQQTGLQNGYTNGFGAQPTGFDQFQQQQQQQQPSFLPQQNTMQPQQTTFNNNPYGQSQSTDIFGQQSPQQSFPQAGSHNPWASNPQQQQSDMLKPMPTGSNNPFAQNFGQQQPIPSKTTTPTLNTLYEQQTATQFTQPTQPNPIASYKVPVQQQQQQLKPQNPQHARLNALLAAGEGQDTFGNVGDLRIPAQHTAPGTFVNSAGGGIERLRAAQTGNNPFFQQQFTGAGPMQGGFGQQVPTQTGPLSSFGSSFGQQNNNPFGARPGPPQQSNSLIDL
jgi:epsin